MSKPYQMLKHDPFIETEVKETAKARKAYDSYDICVTRYMLSCYSLLLLCHCYSLLLLCHCFYTYSNVMLVIMDLPGSLHNGTMLVRTIPKRA